jgi:hypothetical protein
MKEVYIFYGRLVYIFNGHLVYLVGIWYIFWYVVPSGNPGGKLRRAVK